MLDKIKQIFTRPIFNFKVNYWKSFKNLIRGLVVLMFIIAAFIIIKDEVSYLFGSSDYDNNGAKSGEATSSDKSCNVYGVELHGQVVTYISPDGLDKDGKKLQDQASADDIVASINGAEKDDTIKAIILEIDSGGGMPVAGEEIGQALKDVKKPTVALIRGAGDSAAYWAATGANIIVASQNSDVGGIGVTMSYLDASLKNKQDGLTYNQLSVGKFKDAGDPDKNLTAEEKTLMMRDINIMQQNFIKAVAENRKLDIKKVAGLADGSTMLGQMALENGLIDKVGGMDEVKEYLKEKIGADVDICW